MPRKRTDLSNLPVSMRCMVLIAVVVDCVQFLNLKVQRQQFLVLGSQECYLRGTSRLL